MLACPVRKEDKVTGQDLDYKVAEALGWREDWSDRWYDDKGFLRSTVPFQPSRDIQCCFEVIIPFATKEGYWLTLVQLQDTWMAYFDLKAEQSGAKPLATGRICEHENHAAAICLAFLSRKGKP